MAYCPAMPDDRKLDPSLKLLLDALDRTPDNGPLRMHVASVLEKAGRHAQALEHYQRAENDPAVSDDALLGASRCALALPNHSLALEMAERLLARVPDH